MNSRISKLVEIVFDDIPYSLESAEAQEKIESALETEYIKRCENSTEGEALDEILSEYGQLTKMAQLAGYSEEQAKAWRNAGDAVELKSTKKMIRKQRFWTYLSSALCIAAFTEFLWVIYNGVNFKSEFFFVLIMTILYAFLAFKCIRKITKTENSNKELKYDNRAFCYLRELSDKYLKRLFNSIALLIAAIFLFIGTEFSFYIFGNSKSAELSENLFSNMTMVIVPLFLLIKNFILHNIIMNMITPSNRKQSKNAWYRYLHFLLYLLGRHNIIYHN